MRLPLATLALTGAISIGPAHALILACTASYYGMGDGYGGRRTASGERMSPHQRSRSIRPRTLHPPELRRRPGASLSADSDEVARRLIGIGGASRRRSCHTTVRTGPHTAVGQA
jgi:hypothetical protein